MFCSPLFAHEKLIQDNKTFISHISALKLVVLMLQKASQSSFKIYFDLKIFVRPTVKVQDWMILLMNSNCKITSVEGI